MNTRAVVVTSALMAAVVSLTGCGIYHPVSLGHNPYGPAAAAQRIGTDRSLDERYPAPADISEMPFPQGAAAPLPQPAGRAWGVDRRGRWALTPLERQAERKSIARDLPHAVVSPWGTVRAD